MCRWQGDNERATIADSRSRRSQACWIGVWPQGAQVPPRKGCNIKPLSSRKTTLACRRSPLFYPRPVPLAPTTNGSLVAFARTLLRFLISPTQLVQDATHMTWVVGHAELTLDHVGYPRARPLIRMKARRQRTFFQQGYQLMFLPRRQDTTSISHLCWYSDLKRTILSHILAHNTPRKAPPSICPLFSLSLPLLP